MKYILSLAAVFLSASISTFGQAPAAQTLQCSLKVAQSPAVRGIKLGMKVDDVLALFPGSRENEYIKSALTANPGFPNYGMISFGIAPFQYPTKERYVGISQLSFIFVDGRTVRFYVEYGRPPWPRVDEFIDKISDALQLPPKANWTADNQGRKNLLCDGFRIRAATLDQRGSLSIETDDDPYKIQRERRAAEEEKERREFKP